MTTPADMFENGFDASVVMGALLAVFFTAGLMAIGAGWLRRAIRGM